MAEPPVQTITAGAMSETRCNGTPLRRMPGILVILLALGACTGTGTVYDRGPWSHVQRTEPLPQLYTGPWQAPPAEAIEEIGPPPAPSYAARASTSEPMEPIGRWASRSGAALSEDMTPPLYDATPLAGPTADPPQVVSKNAPEPQEARSRARGRTPLTGNWRADEGNGKSCRVQLSSVPALDLYKASSAQCTSKPLQDVNAWSVVDGDIVLYSRGRVVSRLKGDEASFTGTMSESGAAITLMR